MLEILDSLQKILFPLSDPSTKKILDNLINPENLDLDKDIKEWTFTDIRLDEEETLSYSYFSAQLRELYEEVQNPPPKGYFESLIEGKSGPRYVMMATLAGILFTLILAVIAIGISSYQTWLAYQSWKHPEPAGG